jgi:putative alpha-1,2-mannosidase
MWKNIIGMYLQHSMVRVVNSGPETNIMVATHADSLIAEAVVKGVTGFDVNLAWEAVLKDATVPPVNDHNTS